MPSSPLCCKCVSGHLYSTWPVGMSLSTCCISFSLPRTSYLHYRAWRAHSRNIFLLSSTVAWGQGLQGGMSFRSVTSISKSPMLLKLQTMVLSHLKMIIHTFSEGVVLVRALPRTSWNSVLKGNLNVGEDSVRITVILILASLWPIYSAMVLMYLNICCNWWHFICDRFISIAKPKLSLAGLFYSSTR